MGHKGEMAPVFCFSGFHVRARAHTFIRWLTTGKEKYSVRLPGARMSVGSFLTSSVASEASLPGFKPPGGAL